MHVSEGFSIERPPAVFEAGFKLEQRVPARPLAHARGSCSSPGAHELPADPGCSCTGPELRASRTARSLSPEHLGTALPTPQIYPVRGCELFPQLISSLAQQPAKVQTAAAGAGARFTASSPCSETLDAKIEPFGRTTSSWILSNVSSNQGAGKEVKKNNRNILYSRKKERTPLQLFLGKGLAGKRLPPASLSPAAAKSLPATMPTCAAERGALRKLKLPAAPTSPLVSVASSQPFQPNSGGTAPWRLFSEKQGSPFSFQNICTQDCQGCSRQAWLHHSGFSHLLEMAPFPPASDLTASKRNYPRYHASCNIT